MKNKPLIWSDTNGEMQCRYNTMLIGNIVVSKHLYQEQEKYIVNTFFPHSVYSHYHSLKRSTLAEAMHSLEKKWNQFMKKLASGDNPEYLHQRIVTLQEQKSKATTQLNKLLKSIDAIATEARRKEYEAEKNLDIHSENKVAKADMMAARMVLKVIKAINSHE